MGKFGGAMNKATRFLTTGDALVVALGVLAGSSLASALRGPGLWWAIALGAIVSLGVALAAIRLKLLAIEWIAMSLAALIVVGGLAVSPIPSPGGYATFIRGLVGGWADLLTSVPPTEATGTLRVLPYVLTTIATTTGLLLRRKSTRPMLPAIGPLAVFACGLLFSLEASSTIRVQGALLVITALALGWWQQRTAGILVDADIGNTTVARKRGRALYGAALIAVVGVLAPAGAPLLASLHGTDRVDLYQALTPPWDPLEEVSPLAPIQSNYKDNVREDVVFVARGEQIPRRWALATMATYDGEVWTVADVCDVENSVASTCANFIPIDGLAPGDPEDPNREQDPVTVEVEIIGEDVDWPWLPLPGRAHQILAVAEDGSRRDVRFFNRTGTAAIPTGAQRATYTVEATPFPIIADTADVTVATTNRNLEDETDERVSNEALGLTQLPQSFGTQSANFVEGADSGWQEIQELARNLQAGAYLATDAAAPGHSHARLANFLESDVLFGNEEQYAAFAGIAARITTNLPARVVVGWLADDDKALTGELELTRDEATAWIEVLTVEHGWVPVDVTPDRNNEPDLERPGTNFTDFAPPNPPVPPPPPPELSLDQEELEDDDENNTEMEEGGVPVWVQAGGIAASLPVVLGGLWLAAMFALKRRRQRRRRTHTEAHARVSGAWFEAQDRLTEAGLRPRQDLSISEVAHVVDLRFDGATGLPGLARIVDESTFGPEDPNDERAAAAWTQYESLTNVLDESVTPTERIRRIAHPGPLLGGDREPGKPLVKGKR